ncbi:HNH endonuclease family protein [Rhodococcus qingshengii]|uniref:HNH endonuclease family protein n=1 Tax=Rhodococcus qingshengii TaxID=334542 RepID=UPI002F96460D
MRHCSRTALLALGAVTVLGLTGCSAIADADPGTGSLGGAPAVPAPGFDPARALTNLETLPVKGRAPKTGYTREQFGPSWSDDTGVEGGHNGCDTRNDILRRDLVDLTYKSSTRDCVVATGTLHDTYTNTTIAFVRGQDTSTAVQIVHVVALSDGWQKGAQQLSPEQRRDLANDPRNLQAVDGPTNSQKSDSDAASWLPPNKSYRCTYVSRQIDVKALYRLWVTQAEKDAMSQVLHSC